MTKIIFPNIIGAPRQENRPLVFIGGIIVLLALDDLFVVGVGDDGILPAAIGCYAMIPEDTSDTYYCSDCGKMWHN